MRPALQVVVRGGGTESPQCNSRSVLCGGTGAAAYSPDERRPGRSDLSGFLARCAKRWPVRTGGLELAKAASAAGESYRVLLSRPISADDREQISLDICRSGVEDLDLILPAAQMGEHSRAIKRLLCAWCARRGSSGYCQGMNFIASVLLAVTGHAAAPAAAPAGSQVDTADAKRDSAARGSGGTSASAAALRAAEEGAAGRGAGSGTALGSSGSGSSGPPATQPSGGELLSGEETAFWTFVAWVELLLPSDFYAPPDMIGLQR